MLHSLPLIYPDEASLGLAIIEGRPPAAAAAFDRFAPLVRGLLCKTFGPHHDLDDFVQDVFLTLFRRAQELRDPSALRSFVVGITVRVACSELRRRRVRRWLTLSFGDALPEVPVDGADHGARRAVANLYAIMDRIDPESRMAFILRHAEGLEVAEIATSLGVSLATAKRRLAKANERVAFHARRDEALLEVLGTTELSGELEMKEAP